MKITKTPVFAKSMTRPGSTEKERKMPADKTPKKGARVDNDAMINGKRKELRRAIGQKPIPPTHPIEIFNLVELKKDIPNSTFRKGMRGHVVELYENPPRVAEVEIASQLDVQQVEVKDLKFIADI